MLPVIPRKAVVAASLAIYLVLAVLGWAHYVVMHPLDRSRLAGLVVPAPPPGYTPKAASANLVPAASNPFSSYKAAAQHSPGSTAGYSVSWTNPKSSVDSATILVSYLPSASVARQVQSQARTRFLSSESFKSENYKYAQPLGVPGVPGAGGAVFTATGTATTPPVAAVVFATGRAQVLELIGQTGTPAGTGDTAATLARREYDHLARSLPGFQLHRTSVPLVASLIFWGAAAAIAVVAVAVPMVMGRVRRRQEAARVRNAQRQHHVRGSKIARRQARRAVSRR